jgi:hypothetical protein
MCLSFEGELSKDRRVLSILQLRDVNGNKNDGLDEYTQVRSNNDLLKECEKYTKYLFKSKVFFVN